MKFTIKAIALVSCFAAVSMPAAAGTMEDQFAGQLKSFDTLPVMNSANIPVSKPAYGLTRDIFREVDACSVLNAQFIMQPTMKDALSMLRPCLDGVSKMTGNVQISANAVNYGKAIEIVVLGSKNEAVKELVRGSLAKRYNQVFGYPATAVVHTAEPLKYGLTRDVFLEVDACSILNAHFIMQPLMKDALKMLQPCLNGVSELTGGAPISAGSMNYGKAIEIVVLGSKNAAIKELVRGSLVKRNDHIFGYPASVVLNVAAPL